MSRKLGGKLWTECLNILNFYPTKATDVWSKKLSFVSLFCRLHSKFALLRVLCLCVARLSLYNERVLYTLFLSIKTHAMPIITLRNPTPSRICILTCLLYYLTNIIHSEGFSELVRLFLYCI